MQQAASASNEKKMSRKLLILDLNGILADVVDGIPETHQPDARIRRKSVFKRPFCDDFLKFCFENFDVGIWTSRMKKNMDGLVDFLMGNMKHQLLFSWDQSHCTKPGLKISQTEIETAENKHKDLLLKELKYIWENNDELLSWESGKYNESNSLLLDDSPYKAILNPPHTAVFPNSYKFQHENDTSLGPGGDIRVYLEGLVLAENVQKYVEQHPFGQAPIVPSSNVYRQIIEVVKYSELADQRGPSAQNQQSKGMFRQENVYQSHSMQPNYVEQHTFGQAPIAPYRQVVEVVKYSELTDWRGPSIQNQQSRVEVHLGPRNVYQNDYVQQNYVEQHPFGQAPIAPYRQVVEVAKYSEFTDWRGPSTQTQQSRVEVPVCPRNVYQGDYMQQNYVEQHPFGQAPIAPYRQVVEVAKYSELTDRRGPFTQNQQSRGVNLCPRNVYQRDYVQQNYMEQHPFGQLPIAPYRQVVEVAKYSELTDWRGPSTQNQQSRVGVNLFPRNVYQGDYVQQNYVEQHSFGQAPIAPYRQADEVARYSELTDWRGPSHQHQQSKGVGRFRQRNVYQSHPYLRHL